MNTWRSAISSACTFSRGATTWLRKVIRWSGGIASIRSPSATGWAKKAPMSCSCVGPALNTLASTRTLRAGAFPELKTSSSNSNVTWVSSTMHRSGWSPTSIHGRSRVETTPRGSAGAGRGGAGTGAGALTWGGGAGAGAGSGGAKRSSRGPPTNASRDRLRQNRKAPPRPRARAESSHGHSAKSCPGALSGSGAKPETATGSAATVPAWARDDRTCGRAATEVADEVVWLSVSGGRATVCAVLLERPRTRGAISAVFGAGAETGASVDTEVVRLSADGRLGEIVVVVCCGGWSAGRVTVPERLKFCSSLGPTASAAGALVVAAGALCAASGAGPSTSPAVQTAIAKRNPPLIASRSLFVNRQFSWRARHMPAERPVFKHRFDEPRRTQRLTCVDQHELGPI